MDHTQAKQERVLSDLMEHIAAAGLVIQWYHGNAEPGYNDCLTFLANWNETYDPETTGYKPNAVSRIGAFIENYFDKIDVELEWSDEWSDCNECGKIVRISPDSYEYEPYYTIFNECELICHDCADIYDIIEHYQNCDATMARAIPSHWIDAVEKAGFGCLEDCIKYESGFHPGQNDTPEKALSEAREIYGESFDSDFDYIFAITGVGQFDISFTLLVKKVG